MNSNLLSQLRILGTEERRAVDTVYASDGSGQIEQLVPRAIFCSVTVGTEADSVTLSVSEADFDALFKLTERLQSAA